MIPISEPKPQALPVSRPAGQIFVLGAGALGTYLASKLFAGGCNVTVVARGRRLDELRSGGVRLADSDRELRLPCASSPGRLGADDLVILATKTTALAQVVEMFDRYGGMGFNLLTLQNGVETPNILGQLLPSACILGSRVHGFFELQDGKARHVGVEPSIAFGYVPHSKRGNQSQVASCLRRAGIAFSQHDDIAPLLWEKLVLTSALGGVGAMTNLPVGELRSRPDHRAFLEATMAEVVSVARIQGVNLAADTMPNCMAFIDSFPSEARSSLHRDLVDRRPNEFEHLTGAVLRMARAAGTPVPCHEQVAAELTSNGLLPH